MAVFLLFYIINSRVLTTLEDSGNFLILEKSGKTPGILNLLMEFR